MKPPKPSPPVPPPAPLPEWLEVAIALAEVEALRFDLDRSRRALRLAVDDAVRVGLASHAVVARAIELLDNEPPC